MRNKEREERTGRRRRRKVKEVDEEEDKEEVGRPSPEASASPFWWIYACNFVHHCILANGAHWTIPSSLAPCFLPSRLPPSLQFPNSHFITSVASSLSFLFSFPSTFNGCSESVLINLCSFLLLLCRIGLILNEGFPTHFQRMLPRSIIYWLALYRCQTFISSFLPSSVTPSFIIYSPFSTTSSCLFSHVRPSRIVH